MDTSTLLGLFSIKLVELCTVILSLPQKASENHLMKCVVQKKHEKQSSNVPSDRLPFRSARIIVILAEAKMSLEVQGCNNSQYLILPLSRMSKDIDVDFLFILYIYVTNILVRKTLKPMKLFLHVQPPCPRRRSASNATVAKTNSAPHPRRLRDLL